MPCHVTNGRTLSCRASLALPGSATHSRTTLMLCHAALPWDMLSSVLPSQPCLLLCAGAFPLLFDPRSQSCASITNEFADVHKFAVPMLECSQFLFGRDQY